MYIFPAVLIAAILADQYESSPAPPPPAYPGPQGGYGQLSRGEMVASYGQLSRGEMVASYGACPSVVYGLYDPGVVYGANRLSEIEKTVQKIALKYTKPWNLPKLISLTKQRDKLIMAGKSSVDAAVQAIEEKARKLLPNIAPPDEQTLRQLAAERDVLLRQQAGVAA